MEEKTPAQAVKSRQKWQAVFLLLLTLALLLAGVYIGVNWDRIFSVQAAVTQSGTLPVDQNAVDAPDGAAGNAPAAGEPTAIQIPGYEQIDVINQDTLNILLENPSGNPCYFRFTLTNTQGQILYQSQLVPPGKALICPKTDTPLPAGRQNAVLKIETFRLTDQAPMNGASIQILLNAVAAMS